MGFSGGIQEHGQTGCLCASPLVARRSSYRIISLVQVNTLLGRLKCCIRPSSAVAKLLLGQAAWLLKLQV